MLPEKTNTSLTLRDQNDRFAALVGQELSMLHACLKTYGKPFSNDLIRGYLLLLSGIKASATEFREAVATYLAEPGCEFPTPGEFVGRIREAREARETQETMLRAAESIRQNEEEFWREFRLETYGTDEPTTEQIQQKLKGNSYLQMVVGGSESDERKVLDFRARPALEAPKGDA